MSTRAYGMDHDRYDWSLLAQRPPLQWPGECTLALWVCVAVPAYPLNPQKGVVAVPGNMTMPYPDLRHFTLRDYGNRVGIYRVLDALDAAGVQPSFAVNGVVPERYPRLFHTLCQRGNEILAHSWQMDCAHATGVDPALEARWVESTLSTLRQASGQAIRGWLSPGKIQSENTPELLANNGVQYQADWVNDDLPYAFRTQQGELTALPLTTELEDRFLIDENKHSAAEWAQQVMDAADALHAESQHSGGRMLSLHLHPWVIGQPHRIAALEQALAHITALPGVWSASPSDIVTAFRSQPSP